MRKLTVLLVVLLVLSACNTGPTADQIAATVNAQVASTLAAIPTNTPHPTNTPMPTATNTPKPTNTPMPTATNTPKPTNTPTSTPVPPATQTAQAVALKRTAVAIGATATREALIAQRTATAQAIAATATEIARYSTIKWQELVNYADSHKGEHIKVRGTVFNIVGDQELQMWIAGTSEAVYVEMSEPFSGIYEDAVLVVYGEIGGKHCFKNVYDAEICQPLIIDAFYTK